MQTRLEELNCGALQREVADLHEGLVRRARIAEVEREIAEASSSHKVLASEVSHQSTVSRKTQGGWTSQKQPRMGLSPILHYLYNQRRRMQ